MKIYHYTDPFGEDKTAYDIADGSSIRDAARIINNGDDDFTYPVIALVKKENAEDDAVLRENDGWENTIITTDVSFVTLAAGGDSDTKAQITNISMIVIGAILSFTPAAAIGWSFIASGIIGLSMTYLAKPETPAAARGEQKTTSPTYQLNATNIARPGEPIPVRYGRYRVVPDLAAPRWITWEDDASGVRRKYAHAILCLGAGQFNVENVLIGTQPIKNILHGEYTVYAPGVDTAGSIDRENSIDVQSIEVQSVGTNKNNVAVTWLHAGTPTGTSVGTWTASTSYVIGDIVDIDGMYIGGIYMAICAIDHTSAATFSAHTPGEWTIIPNYTINNISWIRGTDGELVGSDKPGGAESLNDTLSTTIIYAPDAAQSDNKKMRTVIWRYASFGGYDWLLCLNNAAYNRLAATDMVNDSETVEISTVNLSPVDYGPFRIPKEGTITINLEFPSGIYRQTGSPVTVHYMIFAHNKIDTQDIVSIEGSATASPWHLLDAGSITEEQYIAWGLSITPSDNSGLPAGDFEDDRMSYSVMRLEAPLASTVGIDRMLWTGFHTINAAPTANPDTTRIQVKFVANSDIQANADKIKVLCERKLPTYAAGTWAAESTTSETVWAICDFIRNQKYGMKLSTTEFDFDGLMTLRDSFAYTWTCNCTFDKATSRWEALKLICRTALMKPIMIAGKIGFVYDGAPQSTLTTMFSMRNIIADSWTYNREEPDQDEPDGVRGIYYDDYSWEQNSVEYTAAGGTPSNPEIIELFGVVDATHAGHIVRQLANAKLYRRNMISFETEMEGHLPLPGDLVPVSYDLPRWGESGVVTAVSDLSLTLNKDVDWSGGPHEILLRRHDGSSYGPVAVTQGASADIIVLPAAADFPIRTALNGERTHFIFGAQNAAKVDILIMDTEPSGGSTVKISGVEYDANVYNGLPV